MANRAATLADLLGAEQLAGSIEMMALMQMGLIDNSESGRPVAMAGNDVGGFQRPKSSRMRGVGSSLMRALRCRALTMLPSAKA